MKEGLEQLHYSVLPPAVYHAYLHPDDMERLRAIVPRIVEEARRALDAEVEALNGPSIVRARLDSKRRFTGGVAFVGSEACAPGRLDAAGGRTHRKNPSLPASSPVLQCRIGGVMRKLWLTAVVLLPPMALAQLSPQATWATHAANEYQMFPNITYSVNNNYESKLDVYKRRDTTGPQPTLVWIHGGGWTGGSKETAVMSLMPWFEMGWNVVNIEYRLARVSLAPAAVEDCLCALRFIAAQAKTYDIDISRLVVSGDSAGGHLALTTGMIPESSGLDRQCPGVPLPKVAAIIDWYGITDVGDLLDGPDRKSYAVAWLGSQPNREEIAHRVSPLTYVRSGLPPILSIQGDADPTVPYSHSVRLQEALEKAGVAHQLVTIPGGKHGNFTPQERTDIYVAVREFLARNGLASK